MSFAVVSRERSPVASLTGRRLQQRQQCSPKHSAPRVSRQRVSATALGHLADAAAHGAHCVAHGTLGALGYSAAWAVERLFNKQPLAVRRQQAEQALAAAEVEAAAAYQVELAGLAVKEAKASVQLAEAKRGLAELDQEEALLQLKDTEAAAAAAKEAQVNNATTAVARSRQEEAADAALALKRAAARAEAAAELAAAAHGRLVAAELKHAQAVSSAVKLRHMLQLSADASSGLQF